jgi:hypothetical protein
MVNDTLVNAVSSPFLEYNSSRCSSGRRVANKESLAQTSDLISVENYRCHTFLTFSGNRLFYNKIMK